MLLYDAPTTSPRRVRIFLAEKGITLATRQVDLVNQENLRPDYLMKNPRGTVPMLETDDGIQLWDTLAICGYLEALYPERPLFGTTPVEHAQVVMWFQRIEEEGFQAVAETFRNSSPFMKGRALTHAFSEQQIPALAERGHRRVARFIQAMNARIAGREYVAGPTYSLADIQLMCVLDFAKRRAEFPIPEDCPALADWHAKVSARPSSGA